MNRNWVRLLAAWLIVVVLGIPGQPVHAESGALSIGLLYPNEGETFYANPLTFIYSFKLRGWVESIAHPLDEIQVEVKIIQDGRLINSKKVAPDADGLFSLPVTANPNSDPGSFTQFQTVCRIDCHYTTDFQLPEGPVTLELTASAPDGSQASLVRHIQVDIARFIKLPVKVSLDGSDDMLPGEIPVSASTRLYLWRARNFSKVANTEGSTVLEVEALSQAETRYVFQVDPVIIDGTLYEGVQPVEVILPPGATTAETIHLRVQAKRGAIEGSVTRPDGSPAGAMEILVIQIPDGVLQRATTAPDGKFSIRDLPVGRYTLTVSPDATAEMGYAFPGMDLDFRTVQERSVTIGLEALPGKDVNGSVVDEDGEVLPFAWILPADTGKSFGNHPVDGSFTLYGMTPEHATLTALAPGYYSQTRKADPGGEAEPLVFELTRRPETINLAWGDGEIIVPSESTTGINAAGITLTNGWIWGKTSSGETMEIHLPDKTIRLQAGQFAIEYLLNGGRGWLVMMEGEAQISGGNMAETIRVSAGQMAALVEGRTPTPVPYEAVVLSVLRAQEAGLVQPVREPTMMDRIRETVAQAGMGTAQVLTLVTYAFILVSLILMPLLGLYWMIRKARKKL